MHLENVDYAVLGEGGGGVRTPGIPSPPRGGPEMRAGLVAIVFKGSILGGMTGRMDWESFSRLLSRRRGMSDDGCHELQLVVYR